MDFVDKWPSRMQGHFFKELSGAGNNFWLGSKQIKYDGVMAWQSGAHVVQHEL